MSDVVSFKVTGLDELQKALEAKGKEGRLALRIALNAGAGDVKSAMQDTAPVEAEGPDAGFLKKNIKTKVTLRRNETAGSAKVGATNAIYPSRGGKHGKVSFRLASGKLVEFMSKHAGAATAAMVGRFLEFGTRKMTPHPWMSRAWDQSKQVAYDHIVRKLKEGLKLQ